MSSSVSGRDKAARPTPAVYRRRRLVALLVLVLVVGGIAWAVQALLLSGDEPAPESVQTHEAGDGGAGASDGADDAGAADSAALAATTSAGQEPGEIVTCAAGDLSIDVSVEPEPSAGSPVTFDVVVRNESRTPCLLDAGPASLVASVTSGSDAVWSSAHCAEDPNELLLDAEAHYTVPVSWDGNRSTAGCAGDQAAAGAGTYRAAFTYAGDRLTLKTPVVLTLD